eukprot:sb/3476070/
MIEGKGHRGRSKELEEAVSVSYSLLSVCNVSGFLYNVVSKVTVQLILFLTFDRLVDNVIRASRGSYHHIWASRGVTNPLHHVADNCIPSDPQKPRDPDQIPRGRRCDLAEFYTGGHIAIS